MRCWWLAVGKFLIEKTATVSLGKTVQGAAAISHVSKTVRTHVISCFGVMVYNEGKLLRSYCKGDIDGAELGNRLLNETMGQGGDMHGWMLGSAFAATLLCGPLAAAACALGGSMVGRWFGPSLFGAFKRIRDPPFWIEVILSVSLCAIVEYNLAQVLFKTFGARMPDLLY